MNNDKCNNVNLSQPNSEEIRKDELRRCHIYQQIGLAAAVVLWLLFWNLLGPETIVEYKRLVINYGAICWPLVVVLQFLVINELLKRKISTKNLSIRENKCKKTKEAISGFVFIGATLFLLRDIEQMELPFVIMHLFIISYITHIVYAVSDMPY